MKTALTKMIQNIDYCLLLYLVVGVIFVNLLQNFFFFPYRGFILVSIAISFVFVLILVVFYKLLDFNVSRDMLKKAILALLFGPFISSSIMVVFFAYLLYLSPVGNKVTFINKGAIVGGKRTGGHYYLVDFFGEKKALAISGKYYAEIEKNPDMYCVRIVYVKTYMKLCFISNYDIINCKL